MRPPEETEREEHLDILKSCVSLKKNSLTSARWGLKNGPTRTTGTKNEVTTVDLNLKEQAQPKKESKEYDL